MDQSPTQLETGNGDGDSHRTSKRRKTMIHYKRCSIGNRLCTLTRRSRVDFRIKTISSTSSIWRDRKDNQWPWQNSTSRGILRLLTESQRDLLREQRELTERTRKLAERVGNVDIENCAATPFLQHLLTSPEEEQGDMANKKVDSHEYLDSTFSVVIAGEFNAGALFFFTFSNSICFTDIAPKL